MRSRFWIALFTGLVAGFAVGLFVLREPEAAPLPDPIAALPDPTTPLPTDDVLASVALEERGDLAGITWADDVQPVFERNGCLACHAGREPKVVEGRSEFALNLDNARLSFLELVWRGEVRGRPGEVLPGGQCCWPVSWPAEHRRRVLPGRPDLSVLVHKLDWDYPEAESVHTWPEGGELMWGPPMPMGRGATQIPEEDRETVRLWIAGSVLVEEETTEIQLLVLNHADQPFAGVRTEWTGDWNGRPLVEQFGSNALYTDEAGLVRLPLPPHSVVSRYWNVHLRSSLLEDRAAIGPVRDGEVSRVVLHLQPPGDPAEYEEYVRTTLERKRALFTEKCSRCHTAERAQFTSAAEGRWETVVARMADKAPGWISGEEVAEIVDFLDITVEERETAQLQERIRGYREAQELFAGKCSKCHELDRILVRRRTLNEWEEVVERMRGKGHSWISRENSTVIAQYLSTVEEQKVSDRLGDVLVRKCTFCHTLERVFVRDRTEIQWSRVVRSMQAKDSESIDDGVVDEVLELLLRTQLLPDGEAAGEVEALPYTKLYTVADILPLFAAPPLVGVRIREMTGGAEAWEGDTDIVVYFGTGEMEVRQTEAMHARVAQALEELRRE